MRIIRRINRFMFKNKEDIIYKRWEKAMVWFGLFVVVASLVLVWVIDNTASAVIFLLAGYIYMLLPVLTATKRKVKELRGAK